MKSLASMNYAGFRSFLRLACLLLLLLAGCSEFDKQAGFPWLTGKKNAPAAKSMTAMWTETVMSQAGQPSTRGFGGRLHFFGEDDKKPLKVKGTLTVYAFEGDDKTASVKPQKKYIFLPEQLESHESESSLGPSYSFWLPWDAVGGPQKQFSLIARFESKEGGVVLSQPTRIVLSGVDESAPPSQNPGQFNRIQADARTYETRTVSMEEPVPPGEKASDADNKMSSFTIDVPSKFLRHTEKNGESAAGDLPAAGDATRSTPAIGPPTTKTGTEKKDTAVKKAAASNSEAKVQEASGETVIEPPARFSQKRFPAQNASSTRPSPDHVRRQPYRGAWPSRLPPTPRSGFGGSESPSAEADTEPVR
jgi:hypothetical protein